MKNGLNFASGHITLTFEGGIFMNIIYTVREGDSYDSAICGYFTSREEAEKYCVLNEGEFGCFIEEAECLDNSTDLSDIKVYYNYIITYSKVGDAGTAWEEAHLNYMPTGYVCADGVSISITPRFGLCLRFYITLNQRNHELAKTKARDMLDELLSMSNNNIDELTVHKMNKKLAAEYKEVD